MTGPASSEGRVGKTLEGEYPYHWKRACAAIIPDAQGRVLLVHHTYLGKRWSLPGGHSETGEDPATTAVREVLEETGIHVTPVRLTGVYYEPQYDLLHLAMLCTRDDPSEIPRPDEDETSEVGYYAPDALPEPMHPITRQRIADALASAPLKLPVLFRR